MVNTIIVFAPHPDDETLACGGTIARKTKEGETVYIVYITDGGNSHLHAMGIAAEPTPQELAKIRRQEAVKAARILGVKSHNLMFLNIEESILRHDSKTVEDMVRQIMLDLRPDEVYYPDRADAHKTHRATYEIVEAALKTMDFSPAKYRYIVWPHEAGRDVNESGRIEVDVGDTLTLKKRAIKEYRSQVTLFSRHQSRPVLPGEFLRCFESKRETFLR